MSALPPFLQALGLDADADERAIRRAYAQRLRQVDPETDPAGFQALRENFEGALTWVGLPLGNAPARRQPPPPQTPPPDTPRSAIARPAHDAFADFAARFDASQHPEIDTAALLADALSDERLVNLEARESFEAQVAERLLAGWRRGHECLFDAARDVFEWETRRLGNLRVGQVGHTLEAAIRERLLLMHSPYRSLHQRLLHRLRSERPTSLFDLVGEMPWVAMLVQRYPKWLRIAASDQIVRCWIDTWNALTPEQRRLAAQSGIGEPAATRVSPAPAAPAAPRRRIPIGPFIFVGMILLSGGYFWLRENG